MNRLAKTALIAVTSVISLGSQPARATSFPETVDQLVPFQQFVGTKSGLGSDNNTRFLWDNGFTGLPVFTYGGSTLWIIDAQGNFLFAGSANIPASVGTGVAKVFIPELPAESNIALHVQSSNNTTLAFALGSAPFTHPTVVATWTFNAQGTLIAAAIYGPFGNTVLEDVSFRDKGVLFVKWGDTVTGAASVWTLNEFGSVTTAAGPFGPFGSARLGEVTLVNGNQLWKWFVPTGGPSFEFGQNIWTINPQGQIINAVSYGPF